jgi:hypothetical protein
MDESYQPPMPEMDFVISGGMIMEQQRNQAQQLQHLQQQHLQLHHQQQQLLPLSRPRHSSSSSMYETPNFTDSLISTDYSFPYYNDGSMDSTATDYSVTLGYLREQAVSLRQNSIYFWGTPVDGFYAGGQSLDGSWLP